MYTKSVALPSKSKLFNFPRKSKNAAVNRVGPPLALSMAQSEAVLGGSAPRENGAFLFRKSTAGTEGYSVVLTMVWNHKLYHFVVKIEQSKAAAAGAAQGAAPLPNEEKAMVKQLRKFVKRFSKKTDGVLPGPLTVRTTTPPAFSRFSSGSPRWDATSLP